MFQKNSQVFCLAHIDLNGTSIVDLAERSNVSKQAASKLVSGSNSFAPAEAKCRVLRVTLLEADTPRLAAPIIETR